MADKNGSRGDASSGWFHYQRKGGYLGPSESKPPSKYQLPSPMPVPKPAKPPTSGGAGK